MAASTASSVPAPWPTENTVRCPAGLARGGVGLSGVSPKAMARLAYSAVRATEPSRSHSHSRVVASLWNSAAIRRRMSARLLEDGDRLLVGIGGEGKEGLLEVAVFGGQLVELDPLAGRAP